MKNQMYTALLPLIFLSLTSCYDKKDSVQALSTEYLEEYNIAVTEPSGLDFTFDKQNLWIVSDETSTIYKLTTNGEVVKKIKVNGYDLEGVCTVDEQKIAVVLERSREVVLLDTNGTELMRTKLNLKGEENSGLEGITFNNNLNRFYVVNEKTPSLLLTLDENLKILSVDTLKLSKDVSGIFYNETNNLLWILSDENQLILKTDLRGNLVEKIELNIVQPEGITIDSEKNRLYIVSDNKDALYVYDINSLKVKK